MALYPPSEYSATSSTEAFAAGSPRIQDTSLISIRARLSQMLRDLEGQAHAVQAAGAQFPIQAAYLRDRILSLREQLDGSMNNSDPELLIGFDAARGKLEIAVTDFYLALGGPDLAVQLQGIGSLRGSESMTPKTKWLLMGGAAFAVAVVALVCASQSTSKKRKGIGSLFDGNKKFKRALPAR